MNRSKLSDYVVTVAAAVMLGGFATTKVIAADRPILVTGEPAPTEVVSYADLDLGNPAGVRALQGRVRAAASRLCLNFGIVSLSERMEQRKCMAFAIDGAQDQIAAASGKSGTQYASRTSFAVKAR